MQALRLNFKEYNFFSMIQPRIGSRSPLHLSQSERETEFLYSFANLLVSVQADYFVGTLSSNWCRLVNELQRTRGDEGRTYHSVDVSAENYKCFDL